MSKTLSLAALALIAAVSVSPAWAADEHNTVPGLTAVGAPLGLHGVDPVAFIDLGNRIEGTAEFTAVHDGVAYYFATEDNLDAFEDDPEKLRSAERRFLHLRRLGRQEVRRRPALCRCG